MNLNSLAFANQESIPSKYTCDGEDINPPLIISDVPEAAVSLALIVDDPDAVKPAGHVWDHWLVFNLPATIREIPEGQQPEGVAGQGSGGNLKYHGPCPPDGEHRYIFKLYALDTKLDLAEGATKPEIESAMEGHILAQTELIGLYNRK